MIIELLYFDDCPFWKMALAALREQVGEDAAIELIRVETQQEAEERRFVGSPTIRVDGNDLFPMAHSEHNLGCRIYPTPAGLRGSPTADMLREALIQHGVVEGGKGRLPGSISLP